MGIFAVSLCVCNYIHTLQRVSFFSQVTSTNASQYIFFIRSSVIVLLLY